MVIRRLEAVKDIGTYIKTDKGFRVTAPEGFVAIKSSSALKLVDRLGSRANFTVKNWNLNKYIRKHAYYNEIHRVPV